MRDAMAAAKDGGLAIILVDEVTNDDNKSKDREEVHANQVTLLRWAANNGVMVCVTHFCAYASYSAQFTPGAISSKEGAAPKVLRDEMPGTSKTYGKKTGDSNGFTNPNLGKDLTSAGVKTVVIAGQSTNACCAATAQGASKLGMAVLTSRTILRGGGASSDELGYYGIEGFGWPDGTVLYSAL